MSQHYNEVTCHEAMCRGKQKAVSHNYFPFHATCYFVMPLYLLDDVARFLKNLYFILPFKKVIIVKDENVVAWKMKKLWLMIACLSPSQ